MLLIRRVLGHSMMPVLPPGTLIIAWRLFRRIKPGDIVVYTLRGKEMIKRATTITDEKVYLLGDNPYDSHDSRVHGTVPLQAIKAVLVWPRDTKA